MSVSNELTWDHIKFKLATSTPLPILLPTTVSSKETDTFSLCLLQANYDVWLRALKLLQNTNLYKLSQVLPIIH